ncbi:MAG TPA: hypothetical protein VEK11_14370, partial [Thermoanaerobaculia bacterium]|nr:hypothetical protein [Thermoanaerobaculia bacterium]
MNEPPVRTPRRVLVTALVAFALAAGIGSAFIRLTDRRSLEQRRQSASDAAAATSLRVERQLEAALAAAATVAALVRAGAETDARDVAEAARRGGVTSVELLAELPVPPGVTEVLSLATPQQLRAAVRVAPSDPRFAAAILDVQELLGRSGIADLANDYEYRLVATDAASGRTIVIARSSPMELADPVRATFAVPQG